MKITSNGSASITIDGRTFKGNNVSIIGNKVVIDGVEQSGELVGNIRITVNGNVDNIETTSGDIEVRGAVGEVETTSGDVIVHSNISGSVKTMSGDVTAGSIGGNVKTMSGDIKTR